MDANQTIAGLDHSTLDVVHEFAHTSYKSVVIGLMMKRSKLAFSINCLFNPIDLLLVNIGF